MTEEQRTPHVFSQLLVARYIFYGPDAAEHCQSHRIEHDTVTASMDTVTVSLARVIGFLLMICRPFVLPAKFVCIGVSQELVKHRCDDPMSVALMVAPNAFSAFMTSCAIVLIGWIAVKSGKHFLKGR